eukprot:7185101-Pyramimonas_sp.AAC.1
MPSDASVSATSRGHSLPSATAPRLNAYRRFCIMGTLARSFREIETSVAVRSGSPQPPGTSLFTWT